MQKVSIGERKRLTDYIEEAAARVHGVVCRLSPEQLTFAPGTDRWSIAQTLEHLTTVATLVLIRIERVAGTSEAEKESPWSGRDEDLLGQIRWRVGERRRRRGPRWC